MLDVAVTSGHLYANPARNFVVTETAWPMFKSGRRELAERGQSGEAVGGAVEPCFVDVCCLRGERRIDVDEVDSAREPFGREDARDVERVAVDQARAAGRRRGPLRFDANQAGHFTRAGRGTGSNLGVEPVARFPDPARPREAQPLIGR